MEIKEINEQYIIDDLIHRFEVCKVKPPFSMESVVEVSEELVNVIRSKKLTYADAYASLELAFQILKHESKFVPIQSPAKELTVEKMTSGNIKTNSISPKLT